MIVTKEIFDEGKSKNGNWSDDQIRCFGVERKNNQGWKKQIIDKDFPEKVIERFLALKDCHLEKRDFTETIKQFWAVVIYSWLGGFGSKK